VGRASQRNRQVSAHVLTFNRGRRRLYPRSSGQRNESAAQGREELDQRPQGLSRQRLPYRGESPLLKTPAWRRRDLAEALRERLLQAGGASRGCLGSFWRAVKRKEGRGQQRPSAYANRAKKCLLKIRSHRLAQSPRDRGDRRSSCNCSHQDSRATGTPPKASAGQGIQTVLRLSQELTVAGIGTHGSYLRIQLLHHC
jgi:hypothetical protein